MDDLAAALWAGWGWGRAASRKPGRCGPLRLPPLAPRQAACGHGRREAKQHPQRRRQRPYAPSGALVLSNKDCHGGGRQHGQKHVPAVLDGQYPSVIPPQAAQMSRSRRRFCLPWQHGAYPCAAKKGVGRGGGKEAAKSVAARGGSCSAIVAALSPRNTGSSGRRTASRPRSAGISRGHAGTRSCWSFARPFGCTARGNPPSACNHAGRS